MKCFAAIKMTIKIKVIGREMYESYNIWFLVKSIEKIGEHVAYNINCKK